MTVIFKTNQNSNEYIKTNVRVKKNQTKPIYIIVNVEILLNIRNQTYIARKMNCFKYESRKLFLLRI